MREILVAAGSSVANIMKVTILLEDMNDFTTVNRIYEDWLHQGGCAADRLPARSTFAVKALPKGAKVEIECIAYADDA
jgi:2-iminobutanoate/2-iminopropanoate deaminase